MTGIERAVMALLDILTTAGCLAGLYLLYLAVFVAPAEALTYAAAGVACAVIPATLASSAHHQVMRRLASRGAQ